MRAAASRSVEAWMADLPATLWDEEVAEVPFGVPEEPDSATDVDEGTECSMNLRRVFGDAGWSTTSSTVSVGSSASQATRRRRLQRQRSKARRAGNAPSQVSSGTQSLTTIVEEIVSVANPSDVGAPAAASTISNDAVWAEDGSIAVHGPPTLAQVVEVADLGDDINPVAVTGYQKTANTFRPAPTPLTDKAKKGLRKGFHVPDSELLNNLLLYAFCKPRNSKLLEELRRKSVAWLSENRPNYSEETKRLTMEAVVTAAMVPTDAETELRVQLAAELTNESIHANAAISRDELGLRRPTFLARLFGAKPEMIRLPGKK